MLTFIFSLMMSVSVNSVAPQAAKVACETYKPNLDGISVTVCGGEVVKRCDQAGNCLFSAETY